MGTRGERDAKLAADSDAICRMGSLMLGAGTGSYRVKAAMGRVAAALGVEDLEAQVSLSEIVATTRADRSFRTQVVEVPAPVVDSDRIEELMRLSLRAQPGLTPDQLQAQLDAVESRPHLYREPVIVAGAALACAAFAFLNNGRWQDCLAAALGAALGKLVQLFARRLRLNHLVIVALAATTACLVYMLTAAVFQFLLPGSQLVHGAAFTSAILFLVPGFPLITAALDLARFDYTSGVSRLLHSALITMAASVGAWVVALTYNLTPTEIELVALGSWALLGFRLLASFFGVLGFALTFNTPWRVALGASVIGTLANVPRLFAMDAGGNPLLCAAAGTLIVGLLAAFAAQRFLAPRITLSVPAMLIMIPGASTYRALVAVIDRDPIAALTNGTTAIGIVVALAAGLVIARMLTDPAWTSTNPTWTHMPRTRAQERLRGTITRE